MFTEYLDDCQYLLFIQIKFYLLFPISMITMLELECCRASSNHEVRWLKVSRLQQKSLESGSEAHFKMPKKFQMYGKRRKATHVKKNIREAIPLYHSYQNQQIEEKEISRTQRTASLPPTSSDSPCNVIHQQCSSCSPVVGTGDRTEGFLPSLIHQCGNKKIPTKLGYFQRNKLIICHSNTKDLIFKNNFY